MFQDVVEGNIIQMADRVMELLQGKYLVSPVRFEGMQRYETLEIPKEALREILYNAIAHKDYTGPDIQMHVYDDHLEIWNEGELPLGYTEETLMGRHSSKPRNRNIANTMFKAGFIDTWGRGYMKIRDGFEAAGIPMPKVQNFCGGVEVTVQRTTFIKMMNVADKTVPNTKYLADTPTSIEQVQTETNQFITDNENIKRLVLVVGEMNLSVSEMMEGTGLKDRKNFLEYSLNPAISDGWVRMLYPDSPRHPRQKYLLTVKGKGLFNRLNGSSWGTGTDTSDSQE